MVGMASTPSAVALRALAVRWDPVATLAQGAVDRLSGDHFQAEAQGALRTSSSLRLPGGRGGSVPASVTRGALRFRG